MFRRFWPFFVITLALALFASACSSGGSGTQPGDPVESIVDDDGNVVLQDLPPGDFILNANPIWDALRPQFPAGGAVGSSSAPRSIASYYLGDPVPGIDVSLEQIPGGGNRGRTRGLISGMAS